MTTFIIPFKSIDKVGLISINIATHIIQGAAERVRGPGDHETNVCCIMPEKLADAISEILTYPRIDCFAASACTCNASTILCMTKASASAARLTWGDVTARVIGTNPPEPESPFQKS